MVLTRTFGPSSSARHCVITMRPALDAHVFTPLRRPLMPVEAPGPGRRRPRGTGAARQLARGHTARRSRTVIVQSSTPRARLRAWATPRPWTWTWTITTCHRKEVMPHENTSR
jgi:hypothetical protein